MAGTQYFYRLRAQNSGGTSTGTITRINGQLQSAVAAYEKLSAEGVKVRVVSMPCWELFDAQPAAYRDSVLLPDVTRRVIDLVRDHAVRDLLPIVAKLLEEISVSERLNDVSPELRESVLNVFNLENKPVEKEVRFRLVTNLIVLERFGERIRCSKVACTSNVEKTLSSCHRVPILRCKVRRRPSLETSQVSARPGW